ncbi:phosphohydrolase [Anaerocaecibacter muris]|uniref:phosphohydrolase n=1 Tax=Anaerocaecibacter muris TaxID=2941513 RepID=UPI002041E9D7|nr:phosphohydrolase [Anaerocaecibacter muris]
MSKEITLNDVKENDEFKQLINASNNSLKVLGYTEHGLRHVGYVSKTTANILSTLGFPQRTVELGAIAGWIHDIGNAINRKHHGLTGSLLAYDILVRMGMDAGEVALIISAIGNHEEETGTPVNEVAAALILADKSDAHRSRVRRETADRKDIHDRVNLSIKKNYLAIDKNKKTIRLVIQMDNTSATMEYLQIYLSRMVLSEKAAAFLGYWFELVINGNVINRRKPVASTNVHPKAGETEVSEE